MKAVWSFILIFISATVFSQNPTPPRPKLVVGIVVDQMRYDYLYRYMADYGPGGFRRLLREGLSCENTHYNYVPTYTAPGHAAIYTGTYPAVNGIIANEWYDHEWGRHRYVTTDTTVQTVGGTGGVGQHSPRVLLTTTITDELRLSNSFQSKVVGVCLKDRGSILPAGHLANACYWFDDKGGNWITSTYYPDSLGLPQWVTDFNVRRLPDAYLSKTWNKLPGVRYDESFADWHAKGYDDGHYITFEGGFPHNLPALKQKLGYSILRFTPFGNSLTLDFALETIEKCNSDKARRPTSSVSVFPARIISGTSSACMPKKPRMPTCASMPTSPACSLTSISVLEKTMCWYSSPPITAAAKRRLIWCKRGCPPVFSRKANWRMPLKTPCPLPSA